MRYAGAMCAYEKSGFAAILCFAIGIALHFLAEQISFNKLTSYIEQEGYAAMIKQNADINLAVQIYNDNPSNRMKKYITSLNATVGQQLNQLIANDK